MQYRRDVSLFHKIFFVTYIFFSALEIIYAIIGVNTNFNLALLFLNSCIFIPLIYRSRDNKHTFVLDPYYICGLWFALCYLISTTPIYLSNDFSRYVTSSNVNYADSSHIIVIIILGIGILFYYLGYSFLSLVRKKDNRDVRVMPKVKISLEQNYKLLIGIYIFSVLFRIYGYSIGAMGSLSARSDAHWPPIPFISVLVYLANVWPVYIGGILLYALEKKEKNTIILLVLIELFFVIVSGDRRNGIYVFFIFLFCYRVANNGLPWPIIKVAVPIALLSLPLLTIIGYVMIYQDDIKLSTIPEIISISIGRLSVLSFSEILRDFIFFPIIDSFGYISNVFVANAEFAMKGDLWGSVGLQNVFSKLIPSFMGGGSFDERYYYQLFAEKFLSYKVDYSFLTFTYQSEMVLSYGLIGIPVGMFVRGMFAAYLFSFMQSSRCHPLYFIFYCGYGYKFILGMGSLLTPDYIVGIRSLFYVTIIIIFLRMFGNRKKRVYS